MSDRLEWFTPHPQEFESAARRITATAGTHGGREAAAVAWLLTFCQSDALQFSPTEVETRMWEVLRFAADGGQGRANYGQTGGLTFHPPTIFEKKVIALSDLQIILRDAIDKYLRVGVASFPKEEAHFTVARGYGSVLFGGRSLRAAFCYLAAQLLARYGERIRPCKGCAVLFLAGRKDQRFHSKTCQILTFVRKQRAKQKAERAAHAQKKKAKRRNKKRANGKGGAHGKKKR